MAGLFPSIGNSQNVDANGQPLASAVLTVYVGGTQALATVFQDIGLIIPGSNPMTADITGRLPLFYVADGTYAVRLVDQFGTQIYFYPQVASIGASSTGGGGTPVDPTTVFQTGDELWQKLDTLRTGWVRQNGLTIGSATSGASERANADCQNLFLFLWNNYSRAHCPVVGGAGANAAADWAANKQITLPDMRGYAPFGLDGMGNARANVIPDGNIAGGETGDTPGASGGAANTAIVQANLPNVNFAVSGSCGVTGTITFNQTSVAGGGGVVGLVTGPAATGTVSIGDGAPNLGQHTNLTANITGAGVVAASGGAGTAVATLSPAKLGCWYIKL